MDEEKPKRKRTRKKDFYLVDVIERCVKNHKGKPTPFGLKR